MDIPKKIATTNGIPLGVHELPAELGIGHDTVDPAGLHGKAEEVNSLYFDLYEGTRTK